jgi:hypothetical protein
MRATAVYSFTEGSSGWKLVHAFLEDELINTIMSI